MILFLTIRNIIKILQIYNYQKELKNNTNNNNLKLEKKPESFEKRIPHPSEQKPEKGKLKPPTTPPPQSIISGVAVPTKIVAQPQTPTSEMVTNVFPSTLPEITTKGFFPSQQPQATNA